LIYRERKFIELANILYHKGWIHFEKLDPGWTMQYNGDEQIFAIIIRTLICNDNSSKRFYSDINGFQGVKEHYTSEDELEEWLRINLKNYLLGTGKGSHRDNRHKLSTPRTIRKYLDLTEPSQTEFLGKVVDFHDLVTQLESVYYIGSLTAFDISKRLIEAELLNHLPQHFYLTGTGEIKGLQALYPTISGKKKLREMGEQLMNKILEQTKIPSELAYFGIEDLLCIYQKDKRFKDFLECSISVEKYASYMLDRKCVLERGVC